MLVDGGRARRVSKDYHYSDHKAFEIALFELSMRGNSEPMFGMFVEVIKGRMECKEYALISAMRRVP